MDMIYSRKRIKLPKIMYSKFNKNNKKFAKYITILGIAIITAIVITNSFSPIFETVCKDKAKSIATIICNEESTKIIQNYKYEDLITISKDKDDNITMIKSNITPINLIISDVAEKIQKRIDQVEQDQVKIKLGSLSGSKILSGTGPAIPLKISTIGNVQTDLRSEFKQAGINQTIHRIYLQVDCQISIVAPHKSMSETISNQVLLAENVIVGKIPQTYYNIDGITSDNLTDLME